MGGVENTGRHRGKETKRERNRAMHLMVELLLGMHMPPGLDSPAQQKKTKKGKKSEKLL